MDYVYVSLLHNGYKLIMDVWSTEKGMRKLLTKRRRIFIIIGFGVLVLGLLNIVTHEFSISNKTKPMVHFQPAYKFTRLPLSREQPNVLPWFRKHDYHIVTNTLKQEPYRGKKDRQNNNQVISNISAGNKNFTAVLILTYMRSGSSLTGEIMQQHPDTFYVFEPLHALEASLRAKFPIQFLNGTFIPYGDYKWEQLLIPTLQAWFNCDIENVFHRGLFDKTFLSFGNKTKHLHKCIDAINPNNSYKIYMSTIRLCVQKLRESCLASKYRVIKSIRTNMWHTKAIMEKVPQLKIIHLVRDPLDTMMSWKVLRACGNNTLDELTNCTSYYCSRLSNDILAKEEMRILKDRVLTVYFEKLVRKPLRVSEEIYKFLGMELTEDIRKAIYYLTSRKPGNKCLVCQQPWQHVGNVSMTGDAAVKKWRKIMPESFKVIVYMLCKESIIYLNYSVNMNPFPS